MKERSLVTVSFELAPQIDPMRFIEWLKVECNVAEDGEGALHGAVHLTESATINVFGVNQRELVHIGREGRQHALRGGRQA